jgi:Brp/Blh family beta-carotene 15,15'-monooxygenase
VTGLAAALAVLGVRATVRQQAAVYVVGMVALNLPHGGYEHFANLRRRAAAFRWRYVGAYLLLVGAFLGLFFLAPLVGLALAVGVACFKGGLGGLAVMDATYGSDHLRTRGQRAVAVAVRGGAVMLLPMYFHTSTFLTYSGFMVGMFDPAAAGPLGEYAGLWSSLALGAWIALATVHVGLGYVRDGGRSWLIDAGETALLGAYFAVVPVVVAVGLYFPLWYSGRQVARHRTVEARSRPANEGFGDEPPNRATSNARAVLAAGGAATVAVVGTIWFVAPNPTGGAPLLPGLVVFWSVAISIVALPHVVVGSWADTERGIWYVP